MAKRSPLPIDVLVGQNIRICRLQKGLSQGELGRRIGVTFQQVQKYEKGANRVGASRLTQIADVLGVPIPTLFDGAPSAGQASPSSPRATCWPSRTRCGCCKVSTRSTTTRRVWRCSIWSRA